VAAAVVVAAVVVVAVVAAAAVVDAAAVVVDAAAVSAAAVVVAAMAMVEAMATAVAFMLRPTATGLAPCRSVRKTGFPQDGYRQKNGAVCEGTLHHSLFGSMTA
jgi:hypothetical protein